MRFEDQKMLPWDSASLKERKIIKEGIVRKVFTRRLFSLPLHTITESWCTSSHYAGRTSHCARSHQSTELILTRTPLLGISYTAGRLIAKGVGEIMYVLSEFMTCVVA